ncbi:aspartyl-phosphate phosphatase Spo0E family protein [Paenibacillus polymyxa]|uniref:aspartyl-phosphate phosphatase Spo0E family protein n=1 Tax=Paenibacillus polymyxa TaxID=1406 RepID=UPI0025B648CB|nr:aspartyl-phosphate phosphatase Spo0E family protein [Paenibacillus polymyxa]MDN4090978.1 aspartyl-phosphate phosphatase Spo0E family protein [Paenibacillus polymyxa]
MLSVQELKRQLEKTRDEMNQMGSYMPLYSPELLEKSTELDMLHNQLEAAKKEEIRLREQPEDQNEA